MAHVPSEIFQDWADGNTINASEYKQEREILRIAVNDNYARLAKSYTVKNADGTTKSTQNLDTAINSLSFKDSDSIIVTLDSVNSILSFSVVDGSVGTANIANGAVTTAKIADASVTGIKIAVGSITADKFVSDALTNDTQNGLRITAIEQDIDAGLAPIPVTIPVGTSIQTITKDSPLSNIEMNGRTLVNILGKDGNCESLTGLTTSGTVASSTTQKKSGSSSIKCTSAGSASFAYKDYTYPLDTTKQYIVACWLYLESYTSGDISLLVRDYGTTTTRYNANNIDTSIVGKWQLAYVKIPTSNALVGSGFRLIFGTTGTVTSVVYIDDVRVYEVPSSIYTAIGTTHTTDAQIDALIPYVDSMKSIFNPYVISEGKNLVPTFNKLSSLHANAVVTDAELLTLTATAANQYSYFTIPVVPNTDYTFFAALGGGANIRANVAANPSVNTGTLGTLNSGLPLTFNSGSNSVVYINLYSTASGTFTFTNPMLNVGSTALPFEPQNQSYTFIQDTFRSNPQGTVFDKLYQDGDNFRKIKRFEEVILDASLSYALISAYTGYKRIQCTSIPATMSNNGAIIMKYNGAIIKDSGESGTDADTGYLRSSRAVNLNLYILDSDTGWGETFTPNAAEILAFTIGYKMNNGTFGTNYNGTGTKTWIPWGATSNTGAVTTVPTTPSTAITSGTYNYYKLQYQLAVSQDVAVEYEGALEVFEGDNQITLLSGVIIREVVTPTISSGNYYIGRLSDSTTHTDYRPDKIIAVYKNGEVDNQWTFEYSVGFTYGNQRAFITEANYDDTSVYEVSYISLDSYQLGFAPQSISTEYQGNMGAVVSKLSNDLVDARTQISVNTNYIIEMLVRMEAGGI